MFNYSSLSSTEIDYFFEQSRFCVENILRCFQIVSKQSL